MPRAFCCLIWRVWGWLNPPSRCAKMVTFCHTLGTNCKSKHSGKQVNPFPRSLLSNAKSASSTSYKVLQLVANFSAKSSASKTLSASIAAAAAIAESTLSAELARITHAIWGQSSYKSEPQSLLMRLIHHKKARHHFVTRTTHSICVHLINERIARAENAFFSQQPPGKKCRASTKKAPAVPKM